MKTQEQIDEIQATLAAANGTENYHRTSLFSRFIFHTDGVEYMANACGAYWLLDAIISHQTKARVRVEPFQVWKLKVKSGKASLTCGDGNGRELARQSIPYTDFPLAEITLYLENGSLDGVHTVKVLMLPGER